MTHISRNDDFCSDLFSVNKETLGTQLDGRPHIMSALSILSRRVYSGVHGQNATGQKQPRTKCHCFILREKMPIRLRIEYSPRLTNATDC